MQNEFTKAFDDLISTGYVQPHCRQANGTEVKPRQIVQGDQVFDWPGKIDHITGAFRHCVIVTGPKPRGLAGYRPNVIGSIPPMTPCWFDDATGLHTWVFQRNSVLQSGEFEASDADGGIFTISVFTNGWTPQEYRLAPTSGIHVITPFPTVGLPPGFPSWVNEACRGIRNSNSYELENAL